MAAEYDTRIPIILPGHSLFFDTCLYLIPSGPVSILELGSGTGYATSLIQKERPDAIISGVDHSPEMIYYAKAKSNLHDVQIHEQDIRDEWPEPAYDVIFTTLCLHHIPRADRRKTLDRIFQSLKQGGIFICGDIIRCSSQVEEDIYTARWLERMIVHGVDQEARNHMAASRNQNLPEMETLDSFIQALKETGFSTVMIPYRYEISAVFAGKK
nr:class I SAM-dependent methyltransferase [uncultured Methanospirillum sp.]